ncbi:MAG: alpha-glucan family phosphorylase, partial [Fimbriimonas ginsengisoli]|nr:alpha-glucan family phosphorylase [Fimbriimonas ginsengisoli]
MKHPKFSRSFEVVSELPVPLRPLRVLAMNLRWSWDHDTRDLFRSVDKELWEEVEHNPVELIERLNPERLERLVKDTGFLNRLASCEKALADYMAAPTWFDANYPKRRDSVTIAYFCAEFGLSEALPIYSGGLGVLAGDHLKAASDLGLPLVGVGLLYSRGYFRQRLNHDGWQEEVYPQIDFFGLPLQLVRGADEAPSRISIEMPDRTVTCQIWKAQIGRIPLYLLDSNVLENAPKDQEITDTLYGGDEEMRIRQEMILGIGGMRALSALGIKPTVCHMNEGHSAFLALERIRQFMAETGSDLSTARQVIVSGDVFTTHTPVPAGFDRFTPDLLERYVGPTAKASGFASDQLLKLGRIERDNQGEPFNMAIFAMANSNYVNGVSQLHASVTREMFQARWPGYPEDEVPIVAITNGVHTHTWISHDMAELFDEYLGQDWRRNTGDPEVWRGVESIPDGELWAVRENLRGSLVRFARRRVQRDLERRSMVSADFSVVGG